MENPYIVKVDNGHNHSSLRWFVHHRLIAGSLLMGLMLAGWLVEAAPVKYRYPLSRASSWTTYRDNDSSGGIIDWNGGKYTYNGHEGTDFASPKGTPIYAAADGVVLEVVDGKFDDCRSGACSPPSNRVKLRHSDGQITYYLHMKKWSIVVKKGQNVKCGQKIGEVASSGRSTGNHLHFQVGDWRKSVEPFKGKRGSSSTLWTSQGSYARSGSVPGQKCDGAKPECTSDSDCKDASKPRCYQNSCIPKPPSGCAFVKTVRLNGLTLNMRQQSNTSSSVIGSIPEGACLAVLQLTNTGQNIQGNTTWYKVTYSGVTGWISGAFADCSSCGGECSNGAKRSCYNGPSGTAGKGICKEGTQTCSSNKWGSCSGQVKPATETCDNNKDDDCDGKTDEGCNTGGCQDGQTQPCYTGPTDTDKKGECKKGTQTCTGGQWGVCMGEVTPVPEQCDGVDNNCDGRLDEGCPSTCVDNDQDGYKRGNACTGEQDCNDNNKEVYPGAKEICGNNIDDNCNGKTDEGCAPTTGCEDKDGDGFKTGADCSQDQPKDCDDNNKEIYPNAKEICGNGIDEDCDGIDLVCKKMGETFCRHDGECDTGFCYIRLNTSICSQRCSGGDCPAGYLCFEGCWPIQQGEPDGGTSDNNTLPIGCRSNIDCNADELCQNSVCIKQRDPGCGCTSQGAADPIFPLLFLLGLLFACRRRLVG